MIGTVFSLELKLGGRRNRLHTFRRVYAGWLIVQFAVFFLLHYYRITHAQDIDIGQFVEVYFPVFAVQHFLLMFLATPAYVAGTITDEKAQGTLLLLLTTDLSSPQIVLGKFLGGLAQVALLALVGLPVLCFMVGYGGLHPAPVFGLMLLSGLLLVGLGAFSMWASVTSRQTREAVLRVYLWSGLAVLAGWGFVRWGLPFAGQALPRNSLLLRYVVRLGDWIQSLNPLALLEPVWGGADWPEFLHRVWPLACTLCMLSVGFLLVSIVRLRPITVREFAGGVRKTRRAPWRPAVDEEDPVRWRERTAGRPLVRWLGVVAVLAASVAASYGVFLTQRPLLFLVEGGLAALFLSFLVGIRASGSVSSERERKTWESVLLTPLETWDLVVDKRTGTLQRFLPHLAAFALPVLPLAIYAGINATAYTLSMLVVALAAMYYMASTGVWCSVKSGTSWRSLFVTMATGYGWGAVVVSGFVFVYGFISCTVTPFVFFFLRLVGVQDLELAALLTGSVVGTVGTLWLLLRKADTKVHFAKEWIDNQERYGRTFARSLARALRKYGERQEQKRREQQEARALASEPVGSEPHA